MLWCLRRRMLCVLGRWTLECSFVGAGNAIEAEQILSLLSMLLESSMSFL